MTIRGGRIDRSYFCGFPMPSSKLAFRYLTSLLAVNRWVHWLSPFIYDPMRIGVSLKPGVEDFYNLSVKFSGETFGINQPKPA